MPIQDEVRPESAEAVSTLRGMGLRVAMLTGDAADVASRVCEAVGIEPENCRARLLPQEKLDWVVRAEGVSVDPSRGSKKQRVCMIGDGINDAAALAGTIF